MLMPGFVLKNVVILAMGYAHVQKEVRKISYAPIVVQVIKVAIIIVLDGKFVVKERVYIEPKACTLECDSRVAYMTCPSSGLAKLYQVCVNCCTVGEDCKLYGHDESLICTEEPQKSELYLQHKASSIICVTL
ncbi:hypothetical protein MTR67_014510 [Solanum verrucosum]|uniref:Uncharacterized protein n=1 Tax=Solanum verrucosum TaxID=315347 RepID=A0AAF0QF45_SOLVR|nr:hypothetical protein MTR67_014510 [Solanum verrucosum]